MKTRRFSSFRELAADLQRDAGRTFLHHWQDPSYRASLPKTWAASLPEGWDAPGKSGTSEAPKFLYRGESGIFPQSLSSRARLARDARFSARDLDLLDRLTNLACEIENRFQADHFRSLGWPQHYGLPTYLLDLTSDPMVALHFAASSSSAHSFPDRVVYRIDLEAIESKVYGLAGQPTPLAAARIEQTTIVRARRQRAWVICARNDPDRFNLQRCWHLWRHLEKFVVDAADAMEFVRPELLTVQDDAYAAWPLAVVRALKIIAGGALPQAVAEWLCARIPLYEWLPVQVQYDGQGRGTSIGLLTPAEAKKRDGRNYEADAETVLKELVSPEVPTPNGIVFGTPTGGQPNTMKWLDPGSECEVQWKTGLQSRDAKPGDWPWAAFPLAFAKVILW
jgi:hypothetical protein